MDILNFISWIASKRRVVTSAPDDALVPIGIRTETRDDKYTTVAIKKSDLITAPEPAYKVYTALLTQSGGDGFIEIFGGDLTIGVTYTIGQTTGGPDWTNVGAPNNNLGTSFVATGTTPNSWGTPGDSSLEYNTGAPVVTVLENTLGINLTFSYVTVGAYTINNANGWDRTKLWYGTSGLGDSGVINVNPGRVVVSIEGPNPDMFIVCYNNDYSATVDAQLLETPIEIRVYN